MTTLVDTAVDLPPVEAPKGPEFGHFFVGILVRAAISEDADAVALCGFTKRARDLREALPPTLDCPVCVHHYIRAERAS